MPEAQKNPIVCLGLWSSPYLRNMRVEISNCPIMVRPKLIPLPHNPLTNINTLPGSTFQSPLLVIVSDECRYADVMHEVRPVTSGYRLVVVYNLVQISPGLTQSAARLSSDKNKLEKTLAAWHRGVKKGNDSAPAFLAYALDYEYTEASLNLDSLKGLDNVKANCLVQSCSQTDVGIYLASCEKTQSGSCKNSEGM